MVLSWALSHPKRLGLQIGMALGWRSPQLVMGMLWEGRMWRGWGYWGSLHVLVLLQTDWDSLQNRGCGAGQGAAPCLACLLLQEQIWGDALCPSFWLPVSGGV